MKHRILSLILGILLLCAPFCAFAEQKKATDLSKQCTAETSDGSKALAASLKGRSSANLKFAQGASFSLRWGDDVPAARLCLEWKTLPENVVVSQYDANDVLLCTETVSGVPSSVTALLPETRKVTVGSEDATMELSLCRVYGEGTLPEPFHEWIDTPDHLDYLLISTHPDDDVLYLGSVVPVYGAEQGYVGSIAYVTCSSRKRMTEAENGAWTMGLRYRPLFLGFADVPSTYSQKEKDKRFPYEELLLGMVRTYRAYRPVVVFAQDQNGEYGHWQHIMTSKAAVEALPLAADSAYDPESVAQYGVWQVQKVFLHLYPENRIAIDATSPLSAFGGKDAVAVAKEAFQKHASQHGGSYTISANTGPLPLNLFGMAAGVVPVGDDVFDNIDPSLLSSYVPPTPAPTPEPTDTPAPTAEPTDTPEPTAEPTNTPCPTPAPTPVPETPATKNGPGLVLPIALIACAVVGGTIGILLVLRARKKRV